MNRGLHALSVLMESRIEQLLNYRRWHRSRSAFLKPYFADIAREDLVELRALLKLRRQARNIARSAEVARSAQVDQGVATWLGR